jgi:tetratricopeptide (TPR) repeat protein
MVALLELIMGLAAVVGIGAFENRADERAEDPFREGMRLLEEEERIGLPTGGDLDAIVSRHVAAKEALSRAAAAKTDDPNVRAWYALALFKIYEKDDALRQADEAVRLGPEVALAYRVRGLVHAGREELGKALEDLNEAVRLGPRDGANLRARGQFFADRHQSNRALAEYSAALKIDERDARTYWLRAMLHMEAMNADLALKDFDAAIVVRPDVIAFRGARGLVRMFKKDYAGVVDDLGVVLKAQPDQEMFCMRAYALTRLDRHEEAIRDVDEAIRFHADAKLFLLRGLSYQKLGRLDRALQDFDEAVKMKSDAETFAARGLLLKSMRRSEQAADDLSEAIRREPANATLRIARGDILLELGREDAAMADYDEGVRLDPDRIESRFARGVGRLIAGRDGAGDDFRAVLRLKGWRHEISTTCIVDAYGADLLAGRGNEAREFLEQALARCDRGAWPYPLLRCLHGSLPEADALAAAPGAAERAQARLYVGIQRITDGRRDKGLDNLRKVCGEAGPSNLTKDIARAVLRRTEEGAVAPKK